MKYHIFEQKDKTKCNSTLWYKDGQVYFYHVVHRSYANILIVSFFQESPQK